jgi:hypothetical protein
VQINLDSEMLKSVVSEAILAVTDLAEVAALVAQILSRHRFDLSDEKVTQAQIADALIAGGVEHRREVRLSQHNRAFRIGGRADSQRVKRRVWRIGKLASAGAMKKDNNLGDALFPRLACSVIQRHEDRPRLKNRLHR